MNSTVSLVTFLRELPPDAQRDLLRRRLTSVTGLRDWFDVADALMATESIDRGLALLPRNDLQALAQNSVNDELLPRLTAVGLATGSCALSEATARAIAVLPEISHEPVDESNNLDERLERAALERAVTLVASVDELLDLMTKRGLRTVSRGSVSAADTTRVKTTVAGLPDDLTMVLQLLESAALVTLSSGIWTVAETSRWSTLGVSGRWGMLADSWRSRLSLPLLDTLISRSNWGAALNAYLDWLFPIDSSDISAQAERAVLQASLLGLAVHDMRSYAGHLVLTGQLDEAVASVDALLPEYIDHILVQSDLTIIAPGPLRPDLESRLRALAHVESRSVASTYRLSPVLIARAMDAGASAAEITDFITSISSTGIPQPVAYVIADVGAKHATVRVRPVSHGTRISCSDPALAARLTADVALRALGLSAESDKELLSPHDSSVVMRNLRAEKYPAALETESGDITPWEPASAPLTATSQTISAIDALLERLNAQSVPSGQSDEQWLVRQIELAIRNRTLVNVTVTLPDGSTREFLIDPRGLSNGRFRGLDRKSQVERTLPLASITTLSVAEVA